uniref:FCP1 homology domain-containing protein n=1 Tax=Phaeomonas parva TaxID=124430 RepID=A0A7S1XYT3_9STRA|mmetsp:Transcript_9781/g.28707  ORF Transcript_9781/g.28707 Transcript_9781/m.28707 type:complete len:418 (+) Transcript_9781:330-1583(+)
MADTLTAPAPPAGVRSPTGASKPRRKSKRPHLFSRENSVTPPPTPLRFNHKVPDPAAPAAPVDEDTATVVMQLPAHVAKAQQEAAQQKPQVTKPALEIDTSTTEDSKETVVDDDEPVTPPPNLIHSTPRHGGMHAAKSPKGGRKSMPAAKSPKNRPTSPKTTASKRKTQGNMLQAGSRRTQSQAEGNFWQRVLCCLRPQSALRHTITSEESNWTPEKEAARGPMRKLLPAPLPEHVGKKCLVLDLDETLVHSSFKATPNPDYIIPVEIDNTEYSVYVQKRPKVDEFLREMAEHFELVVYTASLSKYADPLLDLLDKEKTITYRLFREHCTQFRGSYVKDMGLLNRPLRDSIIVDNSSLSFQFHPENSIHCTSFFDDMSDMELDAIGDFLVDLKDVEDVREHLHEWQEFLLQWNMPPV